MLRNTLVICAAMIPSVGCGLEGFAGNIAHSAYERPASALTGKAEWTGAADAVYSAVDGDGNAIAPFLVKYDAAGKTYEMRLPSSKYQWIIAQARSGNMLASVIVPAIGEETRLTSIDFDARAVTETLIVMSRLSADGLKLKQLTPSVYAGTHAALLAAMGVPGPTQDLLHMVERFMARVDPQLIGGDPAFFNLPAYSGSYKLKTSAIGADFLARHAFDYDGDGSPDDKSDKFDALLAKVAKAAPNPAGCVDPTQIRVMFTVDFNASAQTGNCGTTDRFKWATDKPGKRMFFVGWVHLESEVQDPAINNLFGSSTPNTIPMYDDGTNGDEVAGDNVWTVYFDVPRNPARKLRIGYKYTWGFRGAPWTGSEEWPGNSRILEVVDDNGDGIVFRRDVFGDEATNKDRSNLNVTSPTANGSVTWTTDLHSCGTPESHENGFVNNVCHCQPVATPKSVGPINRACTGP